MVTLTSILSLKGRGRKHLSQLHVDGGACGKDPHSGKIASTTS